MKKILIVMCVSLLLVGCGNKEEVKYNVDTSKTTTTETTTTTTTTTTQAIYKLVLNKEYLNGDRKGTGSDKTFKKNNIVEEGAWAKNAGGSLYRGTYQVDGNTITITMKDMQDELGEWKKLPDSERKPKTYTLTSNTTLVDDKGNTWELK